MRFASDEVDRMVTDSIYVRKSAMKKLQGVEAFLAKKRVRLRGGGGICHHCLLGDVYLPSVAPAQW